MVCFGLPLTSRFVLRQISALRNARPLCGSSCVGSLVDGPRSLLVLGPRVRVVWAAFEFQHPCVGKCVSQSGGLSSPQQTGVQGSRPGFGL